MATLKLKVEADGRSAKAELGGVEKAISNIKKEALGFVGAFVGIEAASKLFRTMVANVQEAESALRQAEARVKSTGAVAGFSAQQLSRMASSLQDITTFGDEAILTAQTLLLTFRNIRGDTFQRTTRAILDMATAMKSDLNSATTQLGKALENPIRGVQLLDRAGISFSTSQKELVKDLVKSGQILEAQNVILTQIEGKFGGAAAAARDTFGGALTSLQNALGDLIEGDGGLDGLKSAIEQVIAKLKEPEVKEGLNLLVREALRLFPVAISLLGDVIRGVSALAPVIATVVSLLASAAGPIAAYVLAFSALPAIYARATAALASFTAMQAASNVGMLASVRNIGLLKAAGGALIALWAGWNIGTTLREQFLEVRLFGIAMIEGLMVGWERLKQGAAIAWEGIKAVVMPIINEIKRQFGSFILEAADGIEKMRSLLGADSEEGNSLVAGMKSFGQSLVAASQGGGSFAEAVAKINADTDAAIASIKTITSDMADYEIAQEGAKQAAKGVAEATLEVIPPTIELGKESAKTAEEIAELEAAQTSLRDILISQAKTMASQSVKAALDYAAAMVKIYDVEQKLIKLNALDAASTRDLAIARQQARAEYDATLTLINEQLSAKDQLLEDMDAEISLLRLSTEEMRVEEIVRRAINQAMQDKQPLSAKEIADLRLSVAERLTLIDTLRREQQQGENLQRMWDSLSSSASDSIGDFATSVLSDFDNIEGAFEDLGDSLLNMVKRTVSQMISEFARLQFINPLLNSLTGSALPVGGSLLGGAGSSFLPALAAIGGGIYGFTNRGRSNGSGGSIAGAAAYGGLAYAGGTIALGAGLGAAGATAGGASALGGAVSGGIGAASALGPVAIALAVAAIVDMISGGRLFGTRFQAERSTTTLGIGAEGGSASASVSEVRQRSLFRGRQWRTRSVDAGDEASAAAADLFESVRNTMVTAAQALKGEAPAVLDAAIRTVNEYDKKGKIKSTKIFVDILGRSWEEATVELASQRITAEALIKTIDSILATGAADVASETMGQLATDIAERWRGDAEQLMDGARFLLAASVDLREGAALLGEGSSLLQITELVEELANTGETLVDAYTRIYTATKLLDDALDLTGVTLDKTREELVRFATDISEAAGGTDEASRLWNSFFQNFFTQSELLAQRVESLRAVSESQLSVLGLDPGISMQGFREAFTAALPTLSPEEIVQWLRAGDALAQFTTATNEYSQAMAQATGLVNQSASEFSEAVRQIVDGANAAAEAAREQGAGETRLAFIHMQAARQVSQAVEMLRSRTRDLIARLYGGVPGSLDEINRRIEELETASGSASDGLNDVSGALDDVFQQWMEGLKGIDNYLKSLVLDQSITTLTPEQQFLEAQRQFEAAAQAAEGGDAEALNSLPQITQTYLQLARSFLSSGDAYQSIFDDVQRRLRALSQVAAPGGGGGGGGGGTVQLVPSPELEALYRARAEAEAQQNAFERRALAIELASNLSDLSAALGVSVFALAGEMGLSLNSLAEDLGVTLDEIGSESILALVAMANALGVSLTELTDGLGITLADLGAGVAELAASVGINLEELTAQSVVSLAELAQSLGVELSELARSLGVDLGMLSDSQSLLNDALESAIDSLPDAQRDRLRPLLEAVEGAVTEADANAALNSLQSEVNQLAPELRDLLAPYFEAIDPSNGSPELTAIRESNNWLRQLLEATRDVAAAVRNRPSAAAATAPGFSSGASYVTRSGVAEIHEGEMVIDPATARDLRRYGIEVRGSNNEQVASELALLRSTMVARTVGTTRGEDEMSRKLDALIKEVETQNRLTREWMLAERTGRR